jgi:isopenicillin N synthase-like dioxygenase
MSRTPHLIADAIPLLDVSAYLAGERATLETLAGELRWAFENVGFYYLPGRGVGSGRARPHRGLRTSE